MAHPFYKKDYKEKFSGDFDKIVSFWKKVKLVISFLGKMDFIEIYWLDPQFEYKNTNNCSKTP